MKERKIREWFTLPVEACTSPEFRAADDAAIGAWIKLYGAAVLADNDGLFPGAWGWRPSQWAAIGVKSKNAVAAERAGYLERLGNDLRVRFYDSDRAAAYRDKCENGANYANRRWHGDGSPIGSPNADKIRLDNTRSDIEEVIGTARAVPSPFQEKSAVTGGPEGDSAAERAACCGPGSRTWQDPPTRLQSITHEFCRGFRDAMGEPYIHDWPRDGAAVRRLPEYFSVERIRPLIAEFFAERDPFVFDRQGPSIATFVSRINALAARRAKREAARNPWAGGITAEEIRRLRGEEP